MRGPRYCWGLGGGCAESDQLPPFLVASGADVSRHDLDPRLLGRVAGLLQHRLILLLGGVAGLLHHRLRYCYWEESLYFFIYCYWEESPYFFVYCYRGELPNFSICSYWGESPDFFIYRLMVCEIHIFVVILVVAIVELTFMTAKGVRGSSTTPSFFTYFLVFSPASARGTAGRRQGRRERNHPGLDVVG